MILTYRRKTDSHELLHVEVKHCCGGIKEAMSLGFIKFGEMDSYYNTNKDINIFKCMPYPEGPVFEEQAIEYCPFCGSKIAIIKI